MSGLTTRHSDWTVRPTEVDERRALSSITEAAFAAPPMSDEQWTKVEPSWLDMSSIGALDGDTFVGHAGSYPVEMVVPGGATVRSAGVTRVAVRPTHRRRGVISSLLAELLAAERSAGAVVASLRASEATIYRRFGFGVAGHADRVAVSTAGVLPVRGAANGTIRSVSRDEVLDVVAPIYDRAATRPGAISRPEWMWRRYLADFLDGSSADHVVAFTSPDGIDVGYAHTTVAWTDDFDQLSSLAGEIHDLWGTTPSVELALWQYLCSVDLVTSYISYERPVDDVIRVAAADPRAVRPRLRYDEQWLRLLDVGAALDARSWPDAAPVTIRVDDPMFPDNCATWRIGPAGVDRADKATADLATGISGLSAAYLGSTSWWELHGADEVDELTMGAISRADTLFATRPLAFCGSHF